MKANGKGRRRRKGKKPPTPTRHRASGTCDTSRIARPKKEKASNWGQPEFSDDCKNDDGGNDANHDEDKDAIVF